MAQYEPFDPAVEIRGEMVLSVFDDGLASFSEAYRDRAFTALDREGIAEPEPDEWYPQAAWLNAFERIASELEPHLLDRLGEQIPVHADWPDGLDSVAAGLRSIDDAYRREHRGGEIGSYRFEPDGERQGRVICRNPYPCEFDRGLIRAVARDHAPVDGLVLVEERGDSCRREGGDTCTYTVSW